MARGAQLLTTANLLTMLARDYPTVSFEAGPAYRWSPEDRCIMYKSNADGTTALFSLLHEVGHASLNHEHYQFDIELLQLEVAAWQRAEAIAPAYSITIDENHVQDCLDSYRDWLYRRSICPICSNKALQQDDGALYRCHNCHATWQVAPSRFCRTYRRQKLESATTMVFAATVAGT